MKLLQFMTKVVDILLRSVDSYDKELTPREKDRLMRVWANQLAYSYPFPKDLWRMIEFDFRTSPLEKGVEELVLRLHLREDDDVDAITHLFRQYMESRGIEHDAVKSIKVDNKLCFVVDLLYGSRYDDGGLINQRVRSIVDMVGALLDRAKLHEEFIPPMRVAIK